MINTIYQRAENFITKSKKLHNNKYDYSKVIYVNAHTKVIIGCPIHGDFEQKPTKHYNHAHGCPSCGGTQSMTISEFIDKSRKVHNDKYSYVLVNYKTSLDDVQIVCPEHGVFKQKPKYHLVGNGCPACGNCPHVTTEDFIIRSTKIHNSKYDYSLANYTKYIDKITIICPLHGKFEQAPSVHLRGGGCTKCNLPGFYSERIFNENEELKTRAARIYFLQFTDKEEGIQFLKVGISQVEIKSRFRYGYSNYEYEILVDKEMGLYEAFRLEQDIMCIFESTSFKPKKPFGGRSECFTLQHKEQIIKTILKS